MNVGSLAFSSDPLSPSFFSIGSAVGSISTAVSPVRGAIGGLFDRLDGRQGLFGVRCGRSDECRGRDAHLDAVRWCGAAEAGPASTAVSAAAAASVLQAFRRREFTAITIATARRNQQ